MVEILEDRHWPAGRGRFPPSRPRKERGILGERTHLPVCSAHSMLQLQIEVQPWRYLFGVSAVSPIRPTVQLHVEMKNDLTVRARDYVFGTASAIRSERSTAMRVGCIALGAMRQESRRQLVRESTFKKCTPRASAPLFVAPKTLTKVIEPIDLVVQMRAAASRLPVCAVMAPLHHPKVPGE